VRPKYLMVGLTGTGTLETVTFVLGGGSPRRPLKNISVSWGATVSPKSLMIRTTDARASFALDFVVPGCYDQSVVGVAYRFAAGGKYGLR